MKHTFKLLVLFFTISITAQTGVIKGIVKNKNNKPIEGVTITYLNKGTLTNKKGEFKIVVNTTKEIFLKFSHVSYKLYSKTISVQKNKTVRLYPILDLKVEKIKEVVVKNHKNNAQGTITINPSDITKIPGANNGVENILMTLAGVNNNNELSTQYNVRGGNFDENLVYVNGIEVYRPFLIRSGQQEGLSFINGDLVQNIKFSAGGFQAKYGDKLSSVLDIKYRTPKEFSLGFEIFNMFDVKNSITNTWVRDASSKKYYGIPNYMTQRVLNIKLDMKF